MTCPEVCTPNYVSATSIWMGSTGRWRLAPAVCSSESYASRYRCESAWTARSKSTSSAARRRRRRPPSHPIRVARLQDGGRRDAGAGRSFAVADSLPQGVQRGARGEALQFAAQELLHRLALQGSARGKLLADFLGNVPDRDLHWHVSIKPAQTAFGNRMYWSGLLPCVVRPLRQAQGRLFGKLRGVQAHHARRGVRTSLAADVPDSRHSGGCRRSDFHESF